MLTLFIFGSWSLKDHVNQVPVAHALLLEVVFEHLLALDAEIPLVVVRYLQPAGYLFCLQLLVTVHAEFVAQELEAVWLTLQCLFHHLNECLLFL